MSSDLGCCEVVSKLLTRCFAGSVSGEKNLRKRYEKSEAELTNEKKLLHNLVSLLLTTMQRRTADKPSDAVSEKRSSKVVQN